MCDYFKWSLELQNVRGHDINLVLLPCFFESYYSE